MRNKLRFNMILLLPFVLKYFFVLVFGNYQGLSFIDLFEDCIFVLVVFLLFNLSNNKYYHLTVILANVIYFLLEGASYLTVSSNFSSSYMYVLIESSKGELKEFLSSYNSLFVIFFVGSIITPFFLFKKRFFVQNRLKSFYSVVIIIILVLGLKLTGYIENNVYHNVVRGVYGYHQLQNNFKLNNSVKKGDIKLLKNNDVLVIVLGESTTRQHMQLYGYKRETTPFLNAFKDSLLVYSDVISSDVITTKSLPKMLTSLDCNLKEDNLQSSIINIFKVLGIKTYWLSNQRPIGYFDNRISKIASNTQYFKFFNHVDEVNTLSYDEVIIPEYERILHEKGKKVIFLHLIGTHFDYQNRYTKKYEKFGKLKQSEKQEIINHYDNAVLYNDFVVKSIMESLKNIKGKRALIYVSDHGENVYDEGDFFGRTETNLKKVMFDIPFLVWTSKDFELPDDFEYVPNRKFMADHLYESLGHLLGVKHKDMDFSKSIFSNTFKERKRIVVNGIDYDDVF
ncbi:phosphoethanolamine transferase [Aestuariibaculum sp. M13]|nr:phosphoethanolamine transferase [Aestuariibaculum sp. M13]